MGGGAKFKGASFIVLVCAAIIMCFCYNTHKVVGDADYNYWGTVAKYFYMTNSFQGLHNVCDHFAPYTPFMGVMYYWVCKAIGSFKENVLFITYVMFVYICLLPLLKPLYWNSKKNILYSGFIVFIYLIFPFVLCNTILFKGLSADIAVGFCFAYALYSILDKDSVNIRAYFFRVIVSVMALTLIKSVAVYLALLCDIYFIYVILHNVHLKKYKLSGYLGVGCSFLPYISWKIFCQLKGWSNIGNKKQLIFPEYTKETIYNYVKMFFDKPLNNYIGITAGGILFLALILIIWHVKRHEANKEYIVLYAILGIGLVFFCIGHLYTYLFVFSEGETRMMSSYPRYLSMYFVAVLYLLFLQAVKSRVERVIIGIILIISMNWNMAKDYLLPQNYVKSMEEQLDYRKKAESQTERIKSAVDLGNVGVIWNGEEIYYLEPKAFRYEMIPFNIQFIQFQSMDQVNYLLEQWKYLYIYTDIGDGMNAGELYELDRRNKMMRRLL